MPGYVYRVGGSGVTRSSELVFPPGNRPLIIKAQPGSIAWQNTGIVLTSVGAFTSVMGILGFVLVAVCSGNECSDTSALRVESALLAAGGAVLMTTGIALIWSQRTRVQTTEQALAAPHLALGRRFVLDRTGLHF
jgi:hypothetical protein